MERNINLLNALNQNQISDLEGIKSESNTTVDHDSSSAMEMLSGNFVFHPFESTVIFVCKKKKKRIT